MLDWIGYSTAPDDAEVAKSLVEKVLIWIMALPWWVPWGFALITTMWLMWISWPRPQKARERAIDDAMQQEVRVDGTHEIEAKPPPKEADVGFHQRVYVGWTQVSKGRLKTDRVIEVAFFCFNGNDEDILIHNSKGSVKIALTDPDGQKRKPVKLPPAPLTEGSEPETRKKSLSEFVIAIEQRLDPETVENLCGLEGDDNAYLYFDELQIRMSKFGDRNDWATLPLQDCVKISTSNDQLFFVGRVVTAQIKSVIG